MFNSRGIFLAYVVHTQTATLDYRFLSCAMNFWMWWYSRIQEWILSHVEAQAVFIMELFWLIFDFQSLTGQSPRSVGCSGRCVRSQLALMSVVSWKWCRKNFGWRLPESFWNDDQIFGGYCNISWTRLRVERKGDFRSFEGYLLARCFWVTLIILVYMCLRGCLCDCFRLGTMYPFWSTLLSHCCPNKQYYKIQLTEFLIPSRIDTDLWELGWWARGCVLRSSLSFLSSEVPRWEKTVKRCLGQRGWWNRD